MCARLCQCSRYDNSCININLTNPSLVHPLHIAFTLLNEDGSLFASIIEKAGGEVAIVKRSLQKSLVRLPTQSPPPDETTLGSASLKVLREAQSLQKNMHDSYIAQDHLLLALIKESTIASILKEANLTEAALKTAIEQTRGNRRVESKTAEQGFDARKSKFLLRYCLLLTFISVQKYAIDLTSLAETGKIDPVIGRDNEIRRTIRILCRR